MKKLILLTLVFSAFLLPTQPAMADHYPDFDKNFLIDNSLFIDYDSMSVAEIQQFLDSNGSLLANWVDNVDMRRPSDNCVVHKATGMTAAEVIYEASTAWNAQIVENCAGTDVSYWGDADYSNYTMPTVSPKVLLVLLQKEQSLISANGAYSTNPNDYKDPTCCASNEYKLARATGYGVPDSGGINEQYLGFYNQINWGSWQLRYNFERSAGNTAWDEVGSKVYTGPMIEGTWKQCATCAPVQFDGYYSIDGSPLYMGNQATASLYYYTPHTHPPYNGNSNFVIFYNDWFGSIYADSYAYKYQSQTKHPAMLQGLSNEVRIRFKNVGLETWYDKSGMSGAPDGTLPMFVSTDKSVGRSSVFSTTWSNSWIASEEFSRVFENDGKTLSVNQDTVETGQIAEYTIKLTARENQKPGKYREHFTLVRWGSSGGKIKGGVVWTDPFVAEAKYSADFVSQSFPSSLGQLESKPASLQLKNTGNIDWYSVNGAPKGYKPIRLATYQPVNVKSPFSRNWFSNNRPVGNNFSAVYESDGVTLSSNQKVVKPGQIASFEFDFSPTKRAINGNLRQYFRLVRENASKPIFGPTMWLPVNYNGGTYIAKWVAQSYNPTVNAGDKTTIVVRYRNDGTATWHDTTGAPAKWSPVRFATTDKINRASNFADTSWLTNNRPSRDFSKVFENDGSTLAANQHEVLPGQIAEFSVTFNIPADTEPGKYREKFVMARDGATAWKMDQVTTMWFDITVQ